MNLKFEILSLPLSVESYAYKLVIKYISPIASWLLSLKRPRIYIDSHDRLIFIVICSYAYLILV